VGICLWADHSHCSTRKVRSSGGCLANSTEPGSDIRLWGVHLRCTGAKAPPSMISGLCRVLVVPTSAGEVDSAGICKVKGSLRCCSYIDGQC
jgi:hypothetical protein